jgi:DNA-binding transcriptional MerR regulator
MTSGVNERPYLSIGEVLGLLLEEFPDVTISKIRFLESQGLIAPERTASGYRKFFDGDVERLKVILREQRENFLPLRVIRDRLETGEIDDTGALSSPSPPRGIRNVRIGTDDTIGIDLDDTGGFEIEVDPTGTISIHAERLTTSRHPAAQVRAAATQPEGTPPSSAAAAMPAVTLPAVVPVSVPTPPVLVAVPSARVLGTEVIEATGVDASTTDVYMRSEICTLGGVTSSQLDELESFGLVSGRGGGANVTYTDTDLAIVRAAAGFLARGIDARHLRAWRQAAEREASLFEQRILPLLRQRNPHARREAIDLLNELAALGAQLRESIVASALRHLVES